MGVDITKNGKGKDIGVLFNVGAQTGKDCLLTNVYSLSSSVFFFFRVMRVFVQCTRFPVRTAVLRQPWKEDW